MSGCCWYAMLRCKVDCPIMFRVIYIQCTLRDFDLRVLKGKQNEKLTTIHQRTNGMYIFLFALVGALHCLAAWTRRILRPFSKHGYDVKIATLVCRMPGEGFTKAQVNVRPDGCYL